MSRESLALAMPPMFVVFLGLVVFGMEWVVARPWLLALLGLAGVGLICLVVLLRGIYQRAKAEEEDRRYERRNRDRRER